GAGGQPGPWSDDLDRADPVALRCGLSAADPATERRLRALLCPDDAGAARHLRKRCQCPSRTSVSEIMNEQAPRRAIADHAPEIEQLGLSSLEQLEEIRQRTAALDFDVKAIWSAVYRTRWIMLVIMSLAILAGMVSAMLSTPIYRASGSVQIDQTTAKVLVT